jgi:DNA (cytosine-5)-methyltransferase 1
MGSDYGLGLGLLVNYLSVCSGIEAATVAWHDMGWKPIGFSEIEKFPSQLLQHHYPHVTNYGDMTKFKEWNINESIGLLVGGTPCQSFSVAGLRKGLEDPRGNLMLTYLGIANHFKPKWLLWENVPGVLSSNGGEDFACLLKGMAELGYGFAYRVLDAQHFGVPQRRRRVFVVGCLGDWRSAAKVLFESESLQRDITPSREERKETSSFTTSSFGNYSEGVGTIRANGGDIGGGSEALYIPNVANCLQTTSNDYSRADGFNMIAMGIYNDISDTVTAKFAKGAELLQQGAKNGGNCIFHSTVLEPKSYGIPGNWIGRKPENGGNATTPMNDISPCLTKTDVHGVSYNMRVRRLTPMECERLQGFPDNYTNTPTSSDTTRYKALGNSMAVPVMKWIGQRINELS